MMFLRVAITLICLALTNVQVGASTTIETTTKCSYSDAGGTTIFDGNCLTNWGTVDIDGCDQGGRFSERYILRFKPGSEAWIFLNCDGRATANDIPAMYTSKYDTDGLYIIQVLTDERELFTFRQISE